MKGPLTNINYDSVRHVGFMEYITPPPDDVIQTGRTVYLPASSLLIDIQYSKVSP
jgi:hypothetical protein